MQKLHVKQIDNESILSFFRADTGTYMTIAWKKKKHEHTYR
jgi:hypothetical protein